MNIVLFDDSSTRILRVTGLLLLCAFVLEGCSSRGSAPVYNRGVSEPPNRVSGLRNPRQRPPVYARSYYLVQPGDTLYSIAWRHNLSYRQLSGWNGIRGPDYSIYPGQRLRLKPPEKRQPPALAKRPATVTPKPRVSVAKPTVKPATAPKVVPKSVTTTSKPPLPASAAKSLKLVWDWPTNGRVVQTYSTGDDNRKGIWIQGRMGQPVTAAEAGKVVYAGNGLVGYGNLIIIKHNRSYLSAYGYNSKLLVREGEAVKKGDVVAHMGAPNTGAQPVLHFEIRRQGKPLNPLPLLPRK